MSQIFGGGSSGGTWGSITGTLSNQTDLQTALDAKLTKLGITTDNALARFDGAAGLLQNSSMLLLDGGTLQGPAGNATNPTYAGQGTASDSGMYFDGTSPTICRDGFSAASFSNHTFYACLQSGQPQYQLYHESSNTVSRGTTGTASLLQQKFGTRTFANTEYLFNAQGNLTNSITAAGNTGSGEDDLHSYPVKGLVLGTDKDSLYWYSAGKFAANANNKQVRVYFNGTLVADSGVVAINDGHYEVFVRVIRTGSATQIAIGRVVLSTNAIVTTYATPTATLANDAIFKSTGEATSDNDISEKYFEIRAVPRGN